MKKLFLSLIVLLSLSLTPLQNIFSYEKSKADNANFISDTQKERVYINGVWFIIVYDVDGGIIEVYKDIIQD